MATSRMSNSLPRTMRRDAAIRGSISSKWNAKLRGWTLPSLSARLLPWVRVTVLSLSSGMARRASLLISSAGSYSLKRHPRPLQRRRLKRAASHRRLCHAGTRGEGLFGGILEGHIGRQDDRSRAHPVVRRVDSGWGDAFLHQRFGRAHQTMPRQDDAVVGGDEIFLGAVADRSHALLQRGILHGEAGNAAKRFARFLSRAVDQIVIVLIRERTVGTGDIFAMHACAIAHGIDFSAC